MGQSPELRKDWKWLYPDTRDIWYQGTMNKGLEKSEEWVRASMLIGREARGLIGRLRIEVMMDEGLGHQFHWRQGVMIIRSLIVRNFDGVCKIVYNYLETIVIIYYNNI